MPNVVYSVPMPVTASPNCQARETQHQRQGRGQRERPPNHIASVPEGTAGRPLPLKSAAVLVVVPAVAGAVGEIAFPNSS